MGFNLNKNLSNFGRSIDLTNKNSNARKAALAPVAVPFALGAGVNQLTGGKTTTYNVWKAASGKAPAPTYSVVTQAASGYQGATPGAGSWALPVVNRSTTKGAGQLVKVAIQDVVAPAADAASKGLFGMSLPALAWTAAGGAAVLLVGPPLVSRALR
ncbi:MAG: hypothetical protein WC876_09115 [Candidatus Thermoplasmatota archaeon]|jgi:hypothetical protein